MKIIIRTSIAIVICIGISANQYAETTPTGPSIDIGQIIIQIGTYKDAQMWQKEERTYSDLLAPHLKTHTQEIIYLLAKEITPIKSEHMRDIFEDIGIPGNTNAIKSISADYHSFMCLVLLQGILNTEFVGSCITSKSCDRLKFTSGQKEPYFKYWPSRDFICIAPIETQAAIIKKIKDYISKIKAKKISPQYNFENIELLGMGTDKQLRKY
jgi:hypothetical protein